MVRSIARSITATRVTDARLKFWSCGNIATKRSIFENMPSRSSKLLVIVRRAFAAVSAA